MRIPRAIPGTPPLAWLGKAFLGIAFPEADGGQGGSLMHAVLAIQRVAWACPKSADIVQAGNFGPIRTFVEYATPEQKARFLPDLLAGRKLVSLGMSEPDAGSAVTDLKTSARIEGDHIVINGSKVFSTHSPEAELFLIYVRFGPGVKGIGSVLIERGTPGFVIGEPSAFMNGEQWSALYFDECRIPLANLLLDPHFAALMADSQQALREVVERAHAKPASGGTAPATDLFGELLAPTADLAAEQLGEHVGLREGAGFDCARLFAGAGDELTLAVHAREPFIGAVLGEGLVGEVPHLPGALDEGLQGDRGSADDVPVEVRGHSHLAVPPVAQQRLEPVLGEEGEDLLGFRGGPVYQCSQ